MNVEVDGLIAAARELKVPLANIRQQALVLDVANAESEAIRREMVWTTDAALRQLNDLIELQKAQTRLELGPVAVRSACAVVWGEFTEINARDNFAVKYRSRRPLVYSNQKCLERILYNLFYNARRINEAECVQVMVSDAAGKLRISVRDHGPALPFKVWREIAAGHKNTPRDIPMRPGSSGLTLYLANKFAETVGGQMGAVRHKDGTSFYVDLPVSQQARLF
ncbi:HAMP domain-containing histidine kinase [Candidatus Saccharibacteria bacterium]|nr:HAMP domain-containing histidine kinase [Candidatus Saccharibacteria bacterium]